MKKLIFLSSILLSYILAGCANSREAAETTVIETSALPTQQTVAETTAPDPYAPGENEILLDLDGDGQVEKLVYQDGSLRRILILDSDGERTVMEEFNLFLCDDMQTVLRFSEGSGGHTWFYYCLENGEMVPFECLVYHWGDNRYFRSKDFSARDDSLKELTEEQYRQAMAAYPCAEAERSYLGELF